MISVLLVEMFVVNWGPVRRRLLLEKTYIWSSRVRGRGWSPLALPWILHCSTPIPPLLSPILFISFANSHLLYAYPSISSLSFPSRREAVSQLQLGDVGSTLSSAGELVLPTSPAETGAELQPQRHFCDMLSPGNASGGNYV